MSRLALALSVSCALGIGSGFRPEAAFAQISAWVEVDLMNVEVRVATRQGEPVEGLSKTDFRLVVDGEPREISHFSILPDSRATSSSVLSPDRRPHGHDQIAIYVDTTFLGPGELSPFVEAMPRLFEDGRTSLMLAVADEDLRIVTGFTAERQKVLDELAKVAGALTPSRSSREFVQLQREFREVLARASSGSMPFVPGAQADALLTRIGSFAAQLENEITGAAERLALLVRMVQGLPGSTTILLLTGRPPIQAGPDLLAAWRREMGQNPLFSSGGPDDQGGGASGQGDMITGIPDVSGFGASSASSLDLDSGVLWQQTGIDAAAAGVTLHVLDLTTTRGEVPGTSAMVEGPGVAAATSATMAAGGASRQGPGGVRILQTLASATGGELVPAGQLQRRGSEAFDPPAARYSLAFVPTREEMTGVHALSVQLARGEPDRLVAHRRFFEIRSPARQLADATISGLLLTRTQNPLAAEIVVGDRDLRAESSSGLTSLHLTLPFSSIGLRPERDYHVGQLSTFSVCGRPFRHAQPVGRQTLPVRVANADMLTTLGRSIEHSWSVEAPNEATHCAVGIRDDLSRLTTTLVVALEEEP